MKAYELVLLDADETLFDFKRAEEYALGRSFEDRNLELTDDAFRDYDEINKGLWRSLERGEIDQSRLRSERFRLLFEKRGLYEDPLAFAEIYVRRLSEAGFLIAGALELCEYLAAKYRLAILTNGIKDVQLSRFGHSPLARFIERIVVSEEAMSSKPDPGIFEYACRALGFDDKARIVMVGDSLASDISGAVAFGIDSCWVNFAGAPRVEGLKPTYEVRSLEEIRKVL